VVFLVAFSVRFVPRQLVSNRRTVNWNEPDRVLWTMKGR